MGRRKGGCIGKEKEGVARQSSATRSPSGTQRVPSRMYPELHAHEATPLDSWHALLEGHWREVQESTAETRQDRDGMGWDGMRWDETG